MSQDDEFEYLRTPDIASDTDPGSRWSARLVTAEQGGLIRTCSYIRTPPGKGSWRGMHTHPFEQLYYVLEGTLSFEVGGRKFEASAGQLVVIPAGVPHENTNTSDRDALQLMIESREP